MKHDAARTIAWMEATLSEAISPESIDIIDESHLHAGHGGAGKGGHFRMTVVAAAFGNLNRVARHRLVYQALQDGMDKGGESLIHALAITALTPDEI